MKKIIAAVIAAVLMVGLFAVPSFAVNKADLLKEAAKSPVYKYVKVALENASKTVEITDEQAEQILPFITRAVTAVKSDNGKSVVMPYTAEQVYTDEQVKEVFECIKGVCNVMGWTYKLIPSANPKHSGDIVFTVYDGSTIIFSYDGDIVADTSASSGSAAFLAVGGVLLLAGMAVVISRKRLVRE